MEADAEVPHTNVAASRATVLHSLAFNVVIIFPCGWFRFKKAFSDYSNKDFLPFNCVAFIKRGLCPVNRFVRRFRHPKFAELNHLDARHQRNERSSAI
jgi:hypothetical protein